MNNVTKVTKAVNILQEERQAETEYVLAFGRTVFALDVVFIS